MALLATTLTKANSCPSIPSATSAQDLFDASDVVLDALVVISWKPKEKPLETHPLLELLLSMLLLLHDDGNDDDDCLLCS